jgi:hypothetical protein
MKNIQFPTLLHPLLSYMCVIIALLQKREVKHTHTYDENGIIGRKMFQLSAFWEQHMRRRRVRSLPLLSSATRAHLFCLPLSRMRQKRVSGIREDVCFHVQAEVGGLPFSMKESNVFVCASDDNNTAGA